MTKRASTAIWFALLSASAFSTGAYAQADEAVVAASKAVKACAAEPEAGFARCHAHILVDDNGKFRVFAGPAGYHPADLRSAYNITGMGSSATTIAIVDAFHYKTANADLKKYRKKFGLPPCTIANGCFRQTDQNGGTNYPATNLGWNQEEALDIEMASAICPNCKIILVEATTNSFGNLATAENTAATLAGVHSISNSYGGGESGTSSFESSYNHPGFAVTVSSGDSGFGVQFPASSPHVTAVGGTTLTRGGGTRGWTETAWSGAGSGCSTVYTKPTWQTDPLCSMRTVADVSADADPNTGVSVFGPNGTGSSSWLVFGGTSVAAPIIAGVYAVNGGAVNYGSNPYGDTADLFDIVSGSNGSCGGTYLCTAKPGYDGPTGLGTPNGVAAF
jgi:subtilase family serine protease